MSENPWIEWSGGECPVDHDALVEVRFRDGNPLGTGLPEKAGYWDSRDSKLSNWIHSKGRLGSGNDIIAYRVVSG